MFPDTDILIRCDATSATGLGHLSRCLGLADAFADVGVHCRLFGQLGDGGRAMLAAAGVEYIEHDRPAGAAGDLSATLTAAQGSRAVLLDSYTVDDAYVASLHTDGAPVLLLDDFCRLVSYQCAAVLNFTVGASRLTYPASGAQMLLGPAYLPVRRALRLARTERIISRPVQRVLVAMGGTDPLDLGRRVVRALVQVAPEVSLLVVVGRDYLARTELEREVRGMGHVAVGLPNLAQALSWADLCVSGGGLTKYEAAYMGVPTAVLSQNDEQAWETRVFAQVGLCADLGLGSAVSDVELAERLIALLADGDRLAKLAREGQTRIPSDAPLRAAHALLAAVSKEVIER